MVLELFIEDLSMIASVMVKKLYTGNLYSCKCNKCISVRIVLKTCMVGDRIKIYLSNTFICNDLFTKKS